MAARPTLSLNTPSVLTKELRIQRNASTGERWVRLSSNLLNGFGFRPDSRINRRILAPGQGFALESDPRGATKVYTRAYNHRRNRPCETVIDLKVQSFIDAALPDWTEAIHFTIKPGQIIAKPQAPRAFHISRGLRASDDPFGAFFGMSSGIDMHCFRQIGWRPRALLEWRPQESRDVSDLTETGVLTAVANSAPDIVFNEDIYTIDMDRVRRHLKRLPPLGLMHLCLQCDDHSNLKAKSLKARSVANLTSTVDMIVPALRLIEEGKPGVVVVENVPPFANSSACEIFTLTLRRWGYHVSTAVLDAREFGGLTGRERLYLVASVWPGFSFPSPIGRAPRTAFDAISHTLPFSRDVTALKTTQDGIREGRIRFVSQDNPHAPTSVKSQSHQPKDGTYIKTPDGRILWPTEEANRILNGIPGDFSFDAVSGGIAIEQIGQGIEYPMHHAVGEAILDHVRKNTNAEPTTTIRLAPASPPPAPSGESENQSTLAL